MSIIGEAPANLMRTILKQGLTTDFNYSFRYRVKNKYGWSVGFSPVLVKLTAKLPDKTLTPEFSIQRLEFVRIDWKAPYNGGNAIKSYTILLLDHDKLNFYEVKAYCDGSQQSILL